LEAASAVGKNGLWNPEKLIKAFFSFNQTRKANTLLTAELNAIGDIACGISATEIPLIQVSQFCGSVSTIGSLRTCEEIQLREYANLAKKCIQIDVTKWNVSTVLKMGSLIGGLSKDELSKMNQEQIQAIPQEVILEIPYSQFAGFTDTQLGFMSENQLAVMTPQQFQSLDPAKQQTIRRKLEKLIADLNQGPFIKDSFFQGPKQAKNYCSVLTASILPVLTIIITFVIHL
jgi:hypothetical protein